MAEYAKTYTSSAVSAAYAAPTHKDSFVRIQNLDDVTTGTDIWVNVKGVGGSAASVEGDECIRIKPGESYDARTSASYYVISASGTPKFLMESSNGR